MSPARRNLDAEVLPVENFKLAAAHLRRPFAPGAVKWKVQSTAGNRGMVVGYIDARLVIERLNLVVPDLWWDAYERLDGTSMICRLTVDGITREDVGTASKAKDLYSDALKRAAVKFGIGVSLYAMKQIWLPVANQAEKGKLQKTQKSTLIPPDTETYLRSLYEGWLDTERGSVFGAALDHGDDPEGSIGEIADVDPPAEPDPEPIDAEERDNLVATIEGMYEQLKAGNGRKWITKGQLDAMIAGAETAEEYRAIANQLDEKIKEATE